VSNHDPQDSEPTAPDRANGATGPAAGGESDGLDVAAVLGSGGLIARRLPHYEIRPQQLEMAAAVQAAIEDERHLVVEAGTGVGKSFGYLVPGILAITDPQFSKQKSPKTGQARHGRLVVSTHTISLQEQLIHKDLPLLNSVMPREFSSVLVKGRGNYISLRRLEYAQQRSQTLFSNQSELIELGKIAEWAKQSGDGSLADLPFRPSPGVWEEVASDASNCLGRKCPRYKDCFHFQARRRASQAQVLVVNHALFFTDLALRREGVKLLPDYDAVIMDEAHTMEAVAADHLGFGATSGQVSYRLSRLYNQRGNRGLLVEHDLRNLQQEVVRLDFEADQFFEDCLQWYQQQPRRSWDSAPGADAVGTDHAAFFSGVDVPPGSVRVRKAGIVRDRLSQGLVKLAAQLKVQAARATDESIEKNFMSAHDSLVQIAQGIRDWCQQPDENSVYWMEIRRRRSGPQVALMAAPIDVGRVLRQSLFAPTPAVIMTSATLSTGGQKQAETASFEFFTSRIGVQETRQLQLGSPFDYARQAELIIVHDMPLPDAKQRYDQACFQAACQGIERHGGHTFILFTSYAALSRMQRQLEPWLRQRGWQVYSQADGVPRSKLVQQFRDNPQGVLLGTDSFWQGVDVPGAALSNVIIPKLPFSVPDHPLLEARLDAIRENGGNPFAQYQLPEAVIKFKQGFGRLIRTARDTGQVVVLDSRIHGKSYGRMFVESLPPLPIKRVSFQQWIGQRNDS